MQSGKHKGLQPGTTACAYLATAASDVTTMRGTDNLYLAKSCAVAPVLANTTTAEALASLAAWTAAATVAPPEKPSSGG